MDEPPPERKRAGRKAVAIAGTGALGASGLSWRLSGVFDSAKGALAEEADQGRLAPWLAAAFCAGVLLYFVAPSEPAWLSAVFLFVAAVGLAVTARNRTLAFAVSVLVAAVAGGFATASIRGAMIAHPVLSVPTATVTLQGFVEARDATLRSDRIILRVTKPDPKAKQAIPERVRLAFRKGLAPAVGEHVQLKARLRPLVGPVRPGGYDFAVGAYFSGLGATGFVLGKSVPAETNLEVPWSIRFSAQIDRLRRGLAERIRSSLTGDSGAIATALVTGIRDHISHEANEAMRISGLYHVISISGLHMALVAGALFALIRGGLALVPGLALRRPVKKYAAIGALIGVTFYLLISGGEVATQRSYIMIAIVLCGVLLDRAALTLRTLSAAVVITLIVSPEAIMNPGFQMSFAATLALISFYERWVPLVSAPPAAGSSAIGAWVARATRWTILGALTSLIAGFATTIYAAFHFHRLAPYGVVANVLSMPLTGLIIMPGALFGVLLIPFGFDYLGWWMMGFGIEWMLRIANFVASLGGAEGRIAAFGLGAVLIATVGLLLLTIPGTNLRWLGIPCAAVAICMMSNGLGYDVLIDPEGDVVAIRMNDGTLSIHTSKNDRFTVENWLAAAGLPPDARRNEFVCDQHGCSGITKDGSLVAVPMTPSALLEDCGRADLVIASREIPSACGSPVIERRSLATTGAIALTRTPYGWSALPARPTFADRPWFGRVNGADANALARLNPATEMKQAVPMTPPAEISGEVPVPDAPDEELFDQ